MKSLVPYMLALCIVPCGCKDEYWVERTAAPEGLNEPLVRVESSQVASGFKHGRLRQQFDVAGFQISRSPITVGQFEACVAAKQCKAPTLDCANLDGDDHDIALCVGYENAKQYCAWSGARLPYLNEWFLAARGRSIQRFSWGDGAASCDQHPLAAPEPPILDPAAVFGGDPEELTPERVEQLRREAQEPADPTKTACGTPLERNLRVGEHRAGASPSGLEDVLLSKAELLTGQRETNFSACMKEDQGCLVFGLIPGGIDAIEPVRHSVPAEAGSATTDGQELERTHSVEHPYAFRCVWPEEGV